MHAELVRILGVPGGRLIDIGCRTGQFLELAAQAGWDAVGVEPDLAAASAARGRGLDARLGSLAEAALEEESFETAVLWDMLDLSEDPEGDLREVFRILKPGGSLWVRVRNAPFNAFLARRGLGLSSLGTLHRHGFGRAQLERALRGGGFEDLCFHRSPSALPGPYLKGLGPASRFLVRAAGALAPTALLVRALKPLSRPRVLHLITRLDPGGSAEAVLSLAGRRCPESTVLASGPGNSGAPAGVRVVPHLVREIRPARDARAFFAILRLLRELKPDILHTHTSKAGLLGRWAAWVHNLGGGGLRTVHSPHGPVFRGYFGPLMSFAVLWAERAAARVTGRLVAVSPAEARENLARGVGREEQWRVVSGGLEIRPAREGDREQARRALKFSPDDWVVGAAARLEPVKGVKFLIEASGLLAAGRPELRVVIFGDGSERAKLEALSNRLGLGDRIFFAGWRNDLPELLPGLDAYVQPSLSEGFGWAALQAQAAGLAVVASATGGLGDLISEGETGLLVPPGDSAALAAALSRLACAPALGGRLGAAAARAAAGTDFGPEAAAEGLEKIYRELLAR